MEMNQSPNQKKPCEAMLRGGLWLDGKMEVHKGDSIIIQDGRVLDVLPDAAAMEAYEPASVVDSRHKLWMPGLIDGHMHTGQQLLRGQILDELPMIWTRIMLPYESTLTAGKMRVSAGLAALEMITSGTTGFVDAGSYFMEEAASVYLQSGLRGVLSHSTMDTDALPDPIRQSAEEAVASTDRLYDRFHRQGCLKVFYSLRALQSCSPALVALAAGRAEERDTFLQAHMSEYPGEVNGCLERHQLRPYEYLEREGALSPRFIGAHSLLLSQHEMDLIKDRKAKVVHCPFSNCGKGIPDTPALMERGVTVGLGTDGTAHGGMSLWNEMKILRSVMNAFWGVSRSNPAVMPAAAILAMATASGAAILGEEGRLGAIGKGCHADLISINLDQPHLTPTGNLTHTLLESVNAGDVSDMMVAGRWLMRDRQVLSLDQERIMHEAKGWLTCP